MKFDIKPAPPPKKRPQYILPLHSLLNLDEVNLRTQNASSLTERFLIKPWLQSRLAPLGILLAIERSDAKKIVFRCRHREQSESDPSKETSTCMFKLRANYSKKAGKWNISIVNDKHSHPLVPNDAFLENDAPIDILHVKPEAVSPPPPRTEGHTELFLLPNYALIAAQLYEPQRQAEADTDNTESLEKLVQSAVGQATHQKQVNERAGEFFRMINEDVLDRVVKKGILMDNRLITEQEKIRIMDMVNRTILRVLDRENVKYWSQ